MTEERTLESIVLRGKHVQLEPYTESHLPELWQVGNHEELWRYMPIEMSTERDMASLLQHLLSMARAGVAQGFAQRALEDDTVVGGTCYLNYDRTNHRVEIGATWITPQRQRSAINTEAKLLLLTHAFETLQCMRVEFKTDALNAGSQTALDRIGAKKEGTLRAHMIMPDGRFRDSVYYSILLNEWPGVKKQLTRRVNTRSH